MALFVKENWMGNFCTVMSNHKTCSHNESFPMLKCVCGDYLGGTLSSVNFQIHEPLAQLIMNFPVTIIGLD